jgi:Lipid A 3-O-deacylase (PagL)
VCESAFALWRSERCFGGNFRLNCLSVLAALCLVAAQLAHSQETTAAVTDSPPATNATVETDTPPATDTIMAAKKPSGKRPVESEIAVTGMIPAGDYRLYSATVRCNAWTVGVEYDRHSWGHFMKSQFDYVVEVIPLLILSEPAKADFWGNPKSPNQQLVPGVSISPFGFRWLWRSNKAVRPYITGKLGAVVFPQKVLSPAASYTNFNVQADFGILFKMTERVDLRVDPFVFFHVSNGYLAASNPGMDELATKIGISYHLGKKEK